LLTGTNATNNNNTYPDRGPGCKVGDCALTSLGLTLDGVLVLLSPETARGPGDLELPNENLLTPPFLPTEPLPLVNSTGGCPLNFDNLRTYIPASI
jgi:hypothetical protein